MSSAHASTKTKAVRRNTSSARKSAVGVAISESASPDGAAVSKASPPSVAIGARLRHARLTKRLRLKDLAERVGVSLSLISKYENDKLLPSLTVLHALVRELDTDIGALFSPDWAASGYVFRAGKRPRLSAAGENGVVGVVLEPLVPHGQGHLLQGNIHIVSPGGGSLGSIRHEGDEVGYVLEGRLELNIEEDCYKLGPGDAFAFPSHLAHSYRNSGRATARVIWVNTPPTF